MSQPQKSLSISIPRPAASVTAASPHATYSVASSYNASTRTPCGSLMDESDFYAATPHPATEGYRAFEELLSRIQETDDDIMSPLADLKHSHETLFRDDQDESRARKLGKFSPMPFSPISRAVNPLPLNSPFEKCLATFEFPTRKVVGKEMRDQTLSPQIVIKG